MADISTDFYTQANPNALFGTAQNALGIQNAKLSNQLLGTQNQQAHQDLVKQQVQYLSGGLGILAKKPDLSQGDMLGFAQNAVKEGIISPQTYQAEAANVAAAGNDPAKLQALATNYAQRALDAGQQFETTFGSPSSVSTGPATVFGSQSALHGFDPASTVANGMAPSDANSMVTVTMPDGTSRQMTKAQSSALLGGGGNQLTNTPTSGNALTGAPSPQQITPPTGTESSLPGISAPSPQQQKMFDASTQQYQDAKTNDAGYTANLVPLEKSLALLPNTPLFGKGAEIPTTIAQVFNTFGIPIGSDQSKNASELDKYLTQIGRASGAAPNSDAQLLAAFSSNPNMSTDKAAAQDVIKTMISLQRMQHAAVTTAQQQGFDTAPQNYTTFASKWGAAQDPRAYGVDLMTPEAKQALMTDLQSDKTGAAKAKFISSLKTAIQSGVLNPPGAASGE